MSISQDSLQASFVLIRAETSQTCSTCDLDTSQGGTHIVGCTEERIGGISVMVSVHLLVSKDFGLLVSDMCQ